MTNLPSEPGGVPRPIPRKALAGAVTILVAYGSLYPFVFHHAGSLGADIGHFLGSMRRPPEGRGDILANVLLYVPLGLAVTLAFAEAMPRILAAFLAVMCGAAMSFSIELAQFYDVTRVSAFSDFFLNVIGLAIGTSLALVAAARQVQASWPSGSAPAFARLLLLTWLGWRLYPYAPTLEIHHYWQSLRPVLLAPTVEPLNIFRYAALWFSVALLFRVGIGRAAGLFPLAMLCYFAAKASIVGQAVVLSELLGAGLVLAIASLPIARFKPASFVAAAAVMVAVILLGRLLPWQLAAVQKPFQWIPFFSFLHGSQAIDTISFAEKSFLYGATLFLLIAAGLNLRIAVALECFLLFATSYLQTFLVGRSAEISDAILALIIGWLYAYMRRQHRDRDRAATMKQAVSGA